MRRFWLWILATIASLCFVAGCSSSDKGEEGSYTVTFRQVGMEDVVFTVDSGESLDTSKIPTLPTKKGYTITWSHSSFENITEDLLITVVATPNEYTVTYDANGGTVTPSTQTVVYDSIPTLATPTRDGYTFTNWTYEGKGVSETWTIAQDVTLKAEWVKSTPKYYTITFVQEGQENIVFENILEGTDYSAQVPAPKGITGYNVVWKAEDLAKLAKVQDNVVVTAQVTPKTYTITFDAGIGTVSPTTMTVTYGQMCTLPIPKYNTGLYFFDGWQIGDVFVKARKCTFVWEFDISETYEAVAEYSDPWTGNY
ncbi:MAG: InlB B-repeat-containing protein [Clostridia bacterium]|nr:InlB B-repeat-containing protein [Clostridia bacterium]